ncbi:MAG: (2Fe-2S) ferredoxin domain-containing protein [Elainellaceae cyanobacterium]
MTSSSIPFNVYDPSSYSADIEMIQGTYLGGTLSSKGYLKGLRLQHHESESFIKLSKPIGCAIAQTIQPGTTIQVWGRPTKDGLNALRVVPISQQDALIDSSNPQIPEQTPPRFTLRLCTRGKCGKRESTHLLQALQTAIQEQRLDHRVTISTDGCLKNCKHGPTLRIEPGGIQYSYVQVHDIPGILKRHCSDHHPPRRFAE